MTPGDDESPDPSDTTAASTAASSGSRERSEQLHAPSERLPGRQRPRTARDLQPPLDTVLAGVGRAHEGDADAILDVVTDDVTWVDDEDRLTGADEVLGHFLAHGGWREVFTVTGVRPLDAIGWRLPDGGRFEVDWTLWLRADSTSYRRDGRAEMVLDDDRILSWTSTATEREDGSLAPWGGD